MQHSILNSYKKDILENKTMTAKCKRVLETSIDLFAKNGYSNTSTSEIAKIAGVAEGTIFKHFGTKENLLLSSIMPFIFDYVLPEMIIDFEDVEIKDIYPDFKSFIHELVNETIESKIQIKNNSNDTMKNIIVSKVLPEGLNYSDSYIRGYEDDGITLKKIK